MKKLAIAFLAVLLAAVCFAGTVPALAEPSGTDTVEYEVVKDDGGAFVGINLLDDFTTALNVKIKPSASFTASKRDMGIVTIDLTGKEIDVSQTSGFALKWKASSISLYPRLLAEDTEGNKYRLFTGSGISYPFIQTDGTATTIMNQGYFALTTAIGGGTLNYFWNKGQFYSLQTGAVTDFTGIRLQKIYIALAMSNAAAAAGGELLIGSFAAFTETDGGAEAEILFNTKMASYAADASDETADINLYDVSKGKLIRADSAADASQGLYPFNTDAEDLATILSNWAWVRVACLLTVNYQDADGGVIAEQSQSYVDAMQPYSVTPPDIDGYRYLSASGALSGTASANITLTLTYGKLYTVEFKNGDAVVSSKEYIEGETIEVPANPEKPSTAEYSYTFAGWSLTENGEIAAPDKVPDDDVVYFAIFIQEKREYSVTVHYTDAGGNTIRPSDSNIYEYGQTYTVSPPAIDGYIYASMNGEAEDTVTGDITITVIYTANADPEQPGTDPEQPGTDPEQPGTDPEQPGTDPEEPGDGGSGGCNASVSVSAAAAAAAAMVLAGVLLRKKRV